MKRNIFNLLMKIKAEVLSSFHQSRKETISTDLQSIASAEDASPILDAMAILPEQELAIPIKSGARPANLIPEIRYFETQDGERSRKLAYMVSGNLDAKNILLCLPGLLETKSSFLVLHSYFLDFEDCMVMSVDFSGRGDSDNVVDQGVYRMSLYLADISMLIQEILFSGKGRSRKLTILGTSMGGVLAMYLTQIFKKRITEIILNDIALTVNWTSLYALYKSMKNELGFMEARELAKELSVDEKAIADVQLPGHFDLSYRADIWGMNFHEALEGYAGKVGLIYGGKSKICTKQRVEEAQIYIPNIKMLEISDSGHPVPFNLQVCEFVHSEMGLFGGL